MRKIAVLMILVVLVFAAIGFAPSTNVAAAPASLANFFPADTFAFVDIDSSDLYGNLTMVVSLVSKISPTAVPADWETMLDKGLSQSIKQPVTIKKDLLGWIGPRIGAGVVIPDSVITGALNSSFSGAQQSALSSPPSYAVIAVKDETGADDFLKNIILKNVRDSSTSTDTINGDSVTIYSTKADGPFIARWKGYLAVGKIGTLLDTLKNKKPTFDTTPTYQKLSATVKTGALANVYVRAYAPPNAALITVTLALLGPAIGNIFNNIVAELQNTPTPTPSPTPPPSNEELALATALKDLGSTLYSVRSDDKVLAIDISTSVNADAAGKIATLVKAPIDQVLLTDPKPIAGKLVGKIPASAFAVMIGSDIPQLYHSNLTLATALINGISILSRQKLPSDPVAMGVAQINAGSQAMLGLDFEKDILGWMGGEFAVYSTYNDNGLFALLSRKQISADSTLLVEATDTAKAGAFVTAVNKVVGAQMGGKAPQLGANGLYSLAPTPGIAINYGLVKDAFVLTSSDGTAPLSALNGDGVLSSDPTWSTAAKQLPTTYSQLWYLNFAQLDKVLATASTNATGSSAAQFQQIQAVLSPFQSAMIYYSGQGNGLASISFLLIQK